MYPTQSTTQVATDDWAVFAADLAATLPDLHPDQICTISVPRGGTTPAQARAAAKVGLIRTLLDVLKRRRQARDTDPFVSFFRMRNSLYGECGGPTDSDGWVRLTAEQQAGIEALGWARATGKERDHWGYPNYCVYFPHWEGVLCRPTGQQVTLPYPAAVDVDRAVRLAIDTLRGPLGADTPRKLTVDRSR